MKNHLKINSFWGFIFFICISFVSCENEPLETIVADKDSEADHNPEISGKKILVRQLSNTASISFYEQDDEVMITVDGHLDEDTNILSKVRSALSTETLVEVYENLFAASNAKMSPPQVLIDLDAKHALLRQDYKEEEEELSETDESVMSSPTIAFEEKNRESKNTGMRKINWNEDAKWFKKLVRSRSSSANEKEHIATNKQWAWANRKGYYHMAFGMSASTKYKARFRGWWEKCAWFSCSYKSHFDVKIKPRHWKLYSWRGSNKYKNRKFRIDGDAPSSSSEKRVHFGLTWSKNKVGSDNPTPPNDLSAHISSYKNKVLTWYVKNNGTTSISRPWIRFTYSPVVNGSQVDEWQIPVTLRPGQTYGDSRSTGSTAIHAKILIDSKNLIRESNELNNMVQRTNSNL